VGEVYLWLPILHFIPMYMRLCEKGKSTYESKCSADTMFEK